ncbi:hypothetical protein DOE76_03250 [Leifsonia sp. ku-ls]|nr:hypothetical protein DOE76_03250 [Leifsonia sp. ku-ls]
MTDIELPIGLTPRVGAEFHLVRWTRGIEEWTAQTILAIYVSSTADEWVVEHRGRRLRLPRQEWLRFMP